MDKVGQSGTDVEVPGIRLYTVLREAGQQTNPTASSAGRPQTLFEVAPKRDLSQDRDQFSHWMKEIRRANEDN